MIQYVDEFLLKLFFLQEEEEEEEEENDLFFFLHFCVHGEEICV